MDMMGVLFHQYLKDIKINVVTKFWHAHQKEFLKVIDMERKMLQTRAIHPTYEIMPVKFLTFSGM